MSPKWSDPDPGFVTLSFDSLNVTPYRNVPFSSSQPVSPATSWSSISSPKLETSSNSKKDDIAMDEKEIAASRTLASETSASDIEDDSNLTLWGISQSVGHQAIPATTDSTSQFNWAIDFTPGYMGAAIHPVFLQDGSQFAVPLSQPLAFNPIAYDNFPNGLPTTQGMVSSYWDGIQQPVFVNGTNAHQHSARSFVAASQFNAPVDLSTSVTLPQAVSQGTIAFQSLGPSMNINMTGLSLGGSVPTMMATNPLEMPVTSDGPLRQSQLYEIAMDSPSPVMVDNQYGPGTPDSFFSTQSFQSSLASATTAATTSLAQHPHEAGYGLISIENVNRALSSGIVPATNLRQVAQEESANGTGSVVSSVVNDQRQRILDTIPPSKLQAMLDYGIPEEGDNLAKDLFIVRGKNLKLSYGQIKAIAGWKHAESTLRGRYRNFTKAKHERLRKPVWLLRDVSLDSFQLLSLCIFKEWQLPTYPSYYLLIFFVQLFILKRAVLVHAGSILDHSSSRNCYNHSPGTRYEIENLPLGIEANISWKSVSEWVYKHGGSYRFGASTTKRQWFEMTRRPRQV